MSYLGKIERLIEDCKSNDSSKQISAIIELVDLGVFDATPTLLNLLKSSEENVRACVAEALGQLGGADIETVGFALIKSLDDPEFLVRTNALESIGYLKYKPAIEAVRTLLRSDSDWVVRATAAETLADLAEIGDPKILADLEFALNDDMAPVRSYAAYSIGLLGEASIDILHRLQVYYLSEDSLETKADILAARYRLGACDDINKLLALVNEGDENLSNVILNILDDLANRRTPVHFLENLSEIREKTREISNLFPVHENRVEQVISTMDKMII